MANQETVHKYDYDYFVIGAGSGGVRSARIAAGHGAKVGIAEGGALGGTCVNVGCVPKKLLTYAADYGPAFEDARGYGWNVESANFNWAQLIDNKNKEISRLNGIYNNLLENAGVTLHNGFATFKDAHTVTVDGQDITADKFLIAVGGTPRRPTYEGAEHVITSNEAFYLENIPSHVVIEGGGYIAVEFAHIFHGLGAKVTISYRGDQILRGFDQDIRDFLTKELKKQGITIETSKKITQITKNNDQLSVILNENDQISCDLVLSAIGRVPNIDGLGLNTIDVATTDRNVISVNEHYQTNQPHIYAVGDVTDRVNLTPVAITEGHWLADTLFGNIDRPAPDYENIPTAVFSSPPIGTVGLSEEQAREKGHEVTVYTSDFKPMRHTLSGRDERTFMKLIVDKVSDKVLGVHMCGTDAPEMMQAMGIALQCGATKADFDNTVGIHPTSAEEFVTMRTPRT